MLTLIVAISAKDHAQETMQVIHEVWYCMITTTGWKTARKSSGKTRLFVRITNDGMLLVKIKRVKRSLSIRKNRCSHSYSTALMVTGTTG